MVRCAMYLPAPVQCTQPSSSSSTLLQLSVIERHSAVKHTTTPDPRQISLSLLPALDLQSWILCKTSPNSWIYIHRCQDRGPDPLHSHWKVRGIVLLSSQLIDYLCKANTWTDKGENLLQKYNGFLEKIRWKCVSVCLRSESGLVTLYRSSRTLIDPPERGEGGLYNLVLIGRKENFTRGQLNYCTYTSVLSESQRRRECY